MPARLNRVTIKDVVSRSFRVDHPEAARSILRMKPSKAMRDRAHALGVLAKKGKLSGDERSELEFYLQLGSLLTLMHSKARLALRPAEPRPRRKTA